MPATVVLKRGSFMVQYALAPKNEALINKIAIMIGDHKRQEAKKVVIAATADILVEDLKIDRIYAIIIATYAYERA